MITPENIPIQLKGLRDHFGTGITRPIEWRVGQLNGLLKICIEKEADLLAAAASDFGSSHDESLFLLSAAKNEIQFTLQNLKKWMNPKKLSNPMSLYPGSTYVVPEPYGVVLDIIPVNCPLYLGIATLIPIFASGNVCCFKPSSNSPNISRLFHQFLPQYLDPNSIFVILSDSSLYEQILNERYDFIFYTGSSIIGQTIMEKASAHLTPVLLELGGKSPVYFDSNCAIEICVERLLFGKIFNNGQGCVPPDYVLVHKDIFDAVKNAILAKITQYYGDVTQPNENICHVINSENFDRLTELIETSEGNILIRGFSDKEKLQMNPTVIENPGVNSRLMKEEVFGPIIPLIQVENEDEAIKFINEREKPLVLYLMTSKKPILNKFISQTSSGSLIHNHVNLNSIGPSSPFGGVGGSGFGQYHGKTGFKALSHMKPVIDHKTMIDPSLKYPPYSLTSLKFLKTMA